MGYEGDKLPDFFGKRARSATDRAVFRMAERAGDRMVSLTVENTPIGGRALEGQGGGNLRTSWYQLDVKPTTRGVTTGYETGVASDVDYAPHVEYGTGLWGPFGRKYLIEPKSPGGVLHWRSPTTGEDVFARRVWHPGSPGQHMVGIAAAVVEAEMEAGLFDDIVHEWARAVEGAAG